MLIQKILYQISSLWKLRFDLEAVESASALLS